MTAFLGASLDGGVGQEVAVFAFWPFRRFAVLCAAILVGAMTHVAWDSFTHQYGWMVQRLPSLSRSVLQTKWGPVPLYKLLEHGNTAVGLTALACMALRDRTWWRGISGVGWKVLTAILVSSGVLGVGFALLKTGWPSDFSTTQRLVGVSVVAFGAAVVGMVTLASLPWHLGERKSEPPPAN